MSHSPHRWGFEPFDLVENEEGDRLEIERRFVNDDTGTQYYAVLNGGKRLWTADILEANYEVVD